MRTTHDNIDIRPESLDEKISEIVKEVNSRDDLNADQIIDRGEMLNRLGIIQTSLQLAHAKEEEPGLFILYRDGSKGKIYWDGQHFKPDRKNCRSFTWSKANEYSSLLSCRFTDKD